MWSILRSLAALTRVRSCLAGAIVCLVGAHVGHGDAGVAREIAAAISTAFVIAFAQVVNDIIDRDLDARDKPGRPLPSGQLSAATAGVVAGICAAAGVLFAFLARPVLVPFALVVLVLSWAYSQFWKSTVLIGNIVVAALASMTVTYGAISSGGELGFSAAVDSADDLHRRLGA